MNDLLEFNQKPLDSLLKNENKDLIRLEDIIKREQYSSFNEILLAHNVTLDKISQREKELNQRLAQIEEDLKINNECDKWDYIFATSAGVIAGLIDSFCVGSPTDSKWLKMSDNATNSLVERFAKLNGWNGPKGNSDPTKSAIGFLERNFKVNYAHQHGSLVNDFMSMSASNHHLKSLAHSPSPLGLIFSLLDQFRGTATFIDNGQLITVTAESQLQGSNFVSKLFCGFTNWIGHLMSDIAGSSGASGRGSGIPIPFYELLQTLNVGSFDYNGEKKHFADIAVKVFEKGYDLRFGAVQSIPVLLVELFIRIFCILRHRYQYNREWKDCLQFLNFDKNARLRKMLLVGQGTLCLVDAGDAFIRSGFAANWVEFFSRMNFVAWMRFSYLGLIHLCSILRNDIEIQRYKLRAKEFDLYVDDIRNIVDTFLVEHNRKVTKFFLERRKELDSLMSSIEIASKNNDHLQVAESVRKIGEMYNIRGSGISFEEFASLDDDDDDYY